MVTDALAYNDINSVYPSVSQYLDSPVQSTYSHPLLSLHNMRQHGKCQGVSTDYKQDYQDMMVPSLQISKSLRRHVIGEDSPIDHSSRSSIPLRFLDKLNHPSCISETICYKSQEAYELYPKTSPELVPTQMI
jgi:hypothetical protein